VVRSPVWPFLFSSHKIKVYGARYIGEQESDVVWKGLGEDGGQGGECMVGAGSDVRDGAIGDDENCSDRINVLLELRRNPLLAEVVVLKVASGGQSRRVENADLGERLRLHTTTANTSTYCYAVIARNFVKVSRVGLALVIGTTLLVRAAECVEVVMATVFADKEIGDEFEDRGLSNTRLSKKEDGVWCFRLWLRCLDDPVLE